MKTLINLLMLMLGLAVSQKIQAQTSQELQIVVEKSSGTIGLVYAADQSPFKKPYQVKLAEVDIYKKNEYVGSLLLENGKLASPDLKQEETLKAAHLQIVLTETNQLLDFKDAPILLK